ncbi:MAG: aminodeoxychorismate synthase component [Glaciihabitans sp.]|nr:aminodeoxychorismate synthase component [Glaciihabitans sp.]
MRPRKLRYPLDFWVEPDVAFCALYGQSTDVVWLDSGVGAQGGLSHIGRASRTVTSDTVAGSMLDFLRAELAANTIEPDGVGFSLGWLGWLGYELRFETLGLERTRTSRYPDAAFVYLDRAIEFDHTTSTVSLIAVGEEWTDDLRLWRDSVISDLSTTSAPPALRRARATGADYWRYSDEEYLAMIAACQAAIAEGEAYQLCLTTEFRIEGTPDPLGSYRALRASSPSHHSALLRIGSISLLSASPEIFLSVSPDGVVESRPIKGTRPRGSTAEQDAVLRDELEGSDKERAENLMIVDLMRNDIARISEIGTVAVTSLLAVESYAQVHQLVSTVQGQLRSGLHAVDAVAACFPAGSMTGAPKRNATVILDGLEQRPRGIYSGAFGYFGLDGRVDLAMVIRSIVMDPHGATVGSGGGITALSDPAEELAEVQLKAAALLAVLGIRS